MLDVFAFVGLLVLTCHQGFKFLLIDTENKYVSSGVAKTLVDRASGRRLALS